MLLRSFQTSKTQALTGLSCLPRRRFSISSSSVIDAAARDGELKVFIVAGEVSGDAIGSRLMASLKKLSHFPIRFSGIGGSMMCEEGLEPLFPMEDISVMGLWELLPHLNKFRVRLKETVEAAVQFRPHCVVTVDSKGFSFRFLKQLRARNVGEGSLVHFHYVAPSFWAWKGGETRLKGLVGFVDHVFCILPNEAAVCQLNGLPATFVGHPVLEDLLELNSGKQSSLCEWKIQGNPDNFRSRFGVSSRKIFRGGKHVACFESCFMIITSCKFLSGEGVDIISLLPGSRLQEVTRMLPIFRAALNELKHSHPDLFTVIHVAPNQDVEDFVGRILNKWPAPAVLVPGGDPLLKYDAFSASKVALCTSGTVAVELQLARLPCAVAYRAHILTEWFIRYKAKIPYISLPNILMDSPVIPESLFQSCTPTNLAGLLGELMESKERRQEQIVIAEKVLRLLFPSERGAKTLGRGDEERKFPHCTPSLIAASTMLSHVK